jgi:hypothetical protein
MRSLEQCGGHPRFGNSGLETAIQEMEAQAADGQSEHVKRKRGFVREGERERRESNL